MSAHATGDDRPTVLLRHDLPDGSWHVDWMLAQDAAGTEPLVTLRLPERLDALPPGAAISAEAIADHRPAYLSYEGPVSGDRGRVRRLARGRIRAWSDDADGWRLEIAWERAAAPDLVQIVVVAMESGRRRTIRCVFAGDEGARP